MGACSIAWVFAESILNVNNGTTSTATLASFGMKQARSGSIALSIGELTKTVTFSTAMADANYEVFFQPQSNVSVVLWASSKTMTNCTLNLSLGISAIVSYAAIAN